MIKQINKHEIVIEIVKDNKTMQKYILIDSEEGQKLIKEHDIVIDENMQEL